MPTLWVLGRRTRKGKILKATNPLQLRHLARSSRGFGCYEVTGKYDRLRDTRLRVPCDNPHWGRGGTIDQENSTATRNEAALHQ